MATKPIWLRKLHVAAHQGYTVDSCQRCARILACIHPGVFSRHVPGDPTRFNATEHCWSCDYDVPFYML